MRMPVRWWPRRRRTRLRGKRWKRSAAGWAAWSATWRSYSIARVVYLAGGVTAHIPQFLHDGRFLQRYLNKGVMTEQLERVPVWRVEHGQLGLLGAVAWYRQNRKA